MVTIHCLNCDADLRVSAMAEAGDLITCQDCDAVFEVVAINPVEIDFADEEEIDGDLLTIEVDDEKAASDDASDDDAEVAWADDWTDAKGESLNDLGDLGDEDSDDDDGGKEEDDEDEWIGNWDDDDLDWDDDDWDNDDLDDDLDDDGDWLDDD